MTNVYINKGVATPELTFKANSGAWRICPDTTAIPSYVKVLEPPKAMLYKGWGAHPHVEWSALYRRGLHLRAVTDVGWETDVITVPMSVIAGLSRDDPQSSWLSPSVWRPVGFNLNGEEVLLGFGGVQVNLTRAQIAKWKQIEWQLVDDIGDVRARAIQKVTPY